MTAADEVLFERRGAAGIITLNRPAALNALTLTMVRAITKELDAWANDTALSVVVIRGAGDRAFCAGGDVRALYESGRAGTAYASDFWYEEYQLNARIKHFSKPFIAFIHGIVMGGGVGVSFHGSHRVTAEKVTFAMPETGIGLFPDVGGTYFLSRLKGGAGLYLALTGARLSAADLRYLGLATHSMPTAAFDTAIAELASGAQPNDVLTRHAQDPGPAPLATHTAAIARHFAVPDTEACLASLDAEGSDWAKETARIIRTKSPVSLKIAARQIALGAALDFNACLALEFAVTERIQKAHDFYEGVRATVIDKDNTPRWNPGQLAQITPAMVDSYFAPLPHPWSPHAPRNA